MNSLAKWIRVAEGMRLVVSAMVSETSNRSGTMLTSVAKHGSEVIANSRKAVTAASTTISYPIFPRSAARNAQTNNMADTKSYQAQEASLDPTPPSLAQQYQGIIQKDECDQDKHIDLESNALEMDPKSIESPSSALHTSNNSRVNHEQKLDQQYTLEINDNRMNLNLEQGSNALKPTVFQEQPLDASGSKLMHDGPYEIQDYKEGQLLSGEHHTLPTIRLGGAVPSSQFSRAMSFASLGIGLAVGSMVEATKRVFVSNLSSSGTTAGSTTTSIISSDANAQRFASTLARLRGAALKLGQMLSIQEDTILTPPLAKALRDVVHQGANAMPMDQLHHQLSTQLGDTEWRSKYFHTFEDHPLAAASIGQVHRATLKDGRKVVVKVQYPGVAESIESDLANLNLLVKATGLAPPGLFIDEIIRVGRKEVLLECDYEREMANQKKFQGLVEADPLLSQVFKVPRVIEELTTKRILTTEFVPGGSIEKVANLSQVERNRIGRAVMALTMKELFEWRFMQTDPNWGNFLYDYGSRNTYLIDFGAAREYDKKFVDGYLRIVWSAANGDAVSLMNQSHKMGFLTGEESDKMRKAHLDSGFVVGEPFQTMEPYDFKSSNLSYRLGQHTALFLQHRLTPPPEEVYTLHRKLAGAYTLCIKLGAVIPCRDLLEEVIQGYEFDKEHSMENK